MSKQFWAVIVAVVIVLIGIFALTGNKSPSGASGGSSSSATHHVEGLGQGHVTLVEYGDYECPYCGQYYPIVKQVVSDFNKQITFQFVNFPLTNLHPNAFAAARAAEAAGLQGKFWQMHDLLYQQNLDNQQNPSAPSWVPASDPTSFFNQDAQTLGLNLNQFKTDYASDKVDNMVTADLNKATSLNLQGTPTFILDGKQISVGENVSDFEKIINAEIAKKAGTSSSSTTPASTGTTPQSKK